MPIPIYSFVAVSTREAADGRSDVPGVIVFHYICEHLSRPPFISVLYGSYIELFCVYIGAYIYVCTFLCVHT